MTSTTDRRTLEASLGRLQRRPGLHALYDLLTQFGDPIRLVNACRNLPRYLRDRRAYQRMGGASRLALVDHRLQLHDRTRVTPIDPHYFYANGWAARRIVASRPALHVDVGSQVQFVNLLAAAVPVTFVDYRPLVHSLPGLAPIAGDLLHLPCADGSLASLSCLHVAEHIGLGRYGDTLDPLGTETACRELSRTLAHGGHLFFAVPVGRERVNFNAHRVFHPQTIISWFSSLTLDEFSVVDDAGIYHERAELEVAAALEYGCGLFHLSKP